jgi:hypothetical protein
MSRKRASRASRVSHEDYDQLLLMLKDMEAPAGSTGEWDQAPAAAEEETGLPPGVYIDSSGNVNDRFLEAVLQDTEFPVDDQIGISAACVEFAWGFVSHHDVCAFSFRLP